MHAIFYMHQTSGMSAGMCMCNRTHQMDKAVVLLIPVSSFLNFFEEL